MSRYTLRKNGDPWNYGWNIIDEQDYSVFLHIPSGVTYLNDSKAMAEEIARQLNEQEASR